MEINRESSCRFPKVRGFADRLRRGSIWHADRVRYAKYGALNDWCELETFRLQTTESSGAMSARSWPGLAVAS